MNGIGSDPLSSFVQPGHASSHPLVPTAGPGCPTPASASSASSKTSGPDGKKPRRRGRESTRKRRCISTACVACRKRKSKCDGAVPSCAACASVYGTECIYDPNSDHRRKGVYREKVDSMKAGSSTLQILIEAILNATEEQAFTIVKKIRTCDSLDTVAEEILRQEDQDEEDEEGREAGYESSGSLTVEGERDLARKMGELRVENGSVRYIGGTSHLIYHGGSYVGINDEQNGDDFAPGTDPITTWTRVTDDAQLITFLINKYFHYHYPYFTTLSKKLFLRDFLKGTAGLERTSTVYCSSLLVNAMLALGCHFTDIPEAYGTPGDNRTKGDGFFAEAKRLIIENGEYEKPRLVTVQALALMSVREAGCAREDKGWVYSGMSFRMAQDIGLNFEVGVTDKDGLDEHEIDARRITFWGCFLFDKCWSNYLGRLPLLPRNSFNIPLIDVFPDEDAELWKPFPDSGPDNTSAQPSRTRAIALQMSKLCEISSDLLIFFYHPDHIGRSSSKAAELKKLSELHKRLEEWHQELPKEFEPKEGQLPNVILMLMFFHLQYIHLFRPFLKYTPTASPLPAHVSPRRICTANAGAISKLMRLYKKTWNLRQICNIAVYMTHSACTIHLLNLPERTARRDIIHGVRHLEEIAEDWLCARRTLSILSVLARKWKCELPEDAALVLQRTDSKYGSYSLSTVPSPGSQPTASPASDGARQEQSQREISPLTQLTQAHMTTKPSSRPIADATMSMYASVPGIDPGPYPSPMDFRGANNVDIGTLQPSHQRTPSYTQTFSPTDAGRFGSSQVVQPGPRLDTSEWFLSDSARWQQSFESWNNAGAGPGQQQQQVFMFGSAGDGGGATSSGAPLSPATAAAMRQHQSSQQQRQQRLQDEDEQLPDFHGLGASGWLAGLD